MNLANGCQRLALPITFVSALALASAPVDHQLKVEVTPKKHWLQVEDTITLPEGTPSAAGPLAFQLHAGLKATSATPGVKVKLKSKKAAAARAGINAGAPGEEAGVPLDEYQLQLPPGVRRFTLKYQGAVHHPLKQQGEEYARSFSETPGSIDTEGIYLAGATHWYPHFDEGLVSFPLEAKLPQGWSVVTQGEREVRDASVPIGGSALQIWKSPEPQDEIYFIGARFTEYRQNAGPVLAMAFLRTPDEALANKYLETTGQYLEMYRRLIGPYPYKKFALVENYWETGYGMPSFTLLGPKIIRFPFILHSSYPHEILHNWWGNSVYVDYQSGNWCEGLTAYLADHLIQEQRGTGAEYRRTTLQRYTDYVSDGKDFPLTEFRSRHSSATEAVGYGKTSLFFHMLRRELGDEVFVQALQDFFKQNRFRQATFADVQRAFSAAAKKDLSPKFAQWVERPGAPALQVRDAQAKPDKQGYLLTGTLEQTQPGPVYRLQVPIAVALEGQEQAFQTTVDMDQAQVQISLPVKHRPLRLSVDPEFDLFRRLDRKEIPPSLSQIFGSPKVLVLLPSAAPAKILQGYRALAESWKESTSDLQVALDSDMAELPVDRSVWLFGWENRFRGQLASGLATYGAQADEAELKLKGQRLSRAQSSVVLVIRHPQKAENALAWVATDNIAAMPGLGRKLPHYGKYGYLGFEGVEPTNHAKGEWPALDSPLSLTVAHSDGRAGGEAKGKLAARQALADLPPAFSQERMMKDVKLLASAEYAGRGFGSSGLDLAADYIARQFKEAGLLPGGSAEGSYFQAWQERGGEPEREATLKNIIAFIPGTNPQFKEQSVVLGAHYDHLGMGWPDVHKADVGKMHPGASDNASGVAVMLELARALGKTLKPERTLVFVAFSGEEANLRGSKYYVEHPRFPLEKTMGMVNLDTVGRFGDNKVTVFGNGSAREWVHIFMGASYVTGVKVEPVANDLGASDQKSFLDRGVPAVQLFTGPNPDYHRASDVAGSVEPEALVKVASVSKEAVEYLTARPEPLTSTLSKAATAGAGQPVPAAEAAPRKVSLGTVPDFAYAGKGLRLSGVSPGSPAEKAGLKTGDVILQIGETPIEDLRGFSNVLKQLKPGDKILIAYSREGKELRVDATVVEK